jgi:two-component system response regulator AtoC
MTAEPQVLVVDDRSEARALIASDLAEAGFRVVLAEDGLAGWRSFRRAEPDLVVTDLRMPGADGIDLLGRIRSVSSVPVIILTAYGDVPTAVAAMKGGAQEFLDFPDDLERLVERARELTRRQTPDATALEALVAGRSLSMRRVRERIHALAPLPLPVLVCGEPGSGRDRVVEALHAASRHAGAPLVKLAAAPGAQPRLPAEGAVFYLDEVARLGPSEQSHWRALAASPERAASQKVLRILASTSDDLAAQARDGRFDACLADALLRFTIQLPALRERADDVPILVRQLASRIGPGMGRESVRFERSALALLKAQRWPGNVRELASVVEKLVAFSAQGSITRESVVAVLSESPDSVSLLRSRKLQAQREELVALLEQCGGNFAEVARRLGISRGAVIYRAQKHGLVPRPR